MFLDFLGPHTGYPYQYLQKEIGCLVGYNRIWEIMVIQFYNYNYYYYSLFFVLVFKD
jgi:hypothetical protein